LLLTSNEAVSLLAPAAGPLCCRWSGDRCEDLLLLV